MDEKILILTGPGDLHACAVAEALRRKGGEAVIWYTTDFPTRSGESVLLEEREARVRIEGPGLVLDGGPFRSVWRRRPAHALDRERLHPDDRTFAELECAVFRRSLFEVLLPDSFWVNSPTAALAAGQKLLQQRLAQKVGFKTPAALYSNDPGMIREFIRKHDRRVVHKTLRGTSWREGASSWFPFTTVLTEQDLVEDALLRMTPGIYQEVIPKAAELRVTVIGNQVLAAKLTSRNLDSIDWRKASCEVQVEPLALPSSIKDLCLSLMARLGLVFGCFDLIETPEREYVFLEVNEMGQFLFVEQACELPLMDAFSELLLQGRPDFEWDERRSGLTFAAIAETAQAAAAESLKDHPPPPGEVDLSE